MSRVLTGALCVALLAAGRAAADRKMLPGGSSANNRAAAQLLQQQVKALRQEQRAAEQAVKARFDAIIHADLLNENQLRQERTALKKQEDTILALTNDPIQREAIRTLYDGLRARLKTGIKLDESAIRQLREQERAAIQQIKALYKIRIQALEQQLRALR
jgi:hypothetical protein